MRFTQQEKYEIIRLVETSEIGVNRTLKEIGIIEYKNKKISVVDCDKIEELLRLTIE